MPTLELRGCCFVGLRYGVAVANHNRCYGKRRCEVLAGSLPAEQPILPLEQVQGMTVGDRPGTHRFWDSVAARVCEQRKRAFRCITRGHDKNCA